MRSLFILIFICYTAILNAQIKPASKTCTVEKNASLSIQDFDNAPTVGVEIKKGNKLVFTYEWHSADNPQIADDESVHKLYFELPVNFKGWMLVKKEELKKYNTIRCRICFCLEGGCRRADKGELSVEKIGCKRYHVTYKDEADSDEKYFFDEIFTLKKQKK